MMNPRSRTGAGLPYSLELETATKVPTISGEPSLKDIPPAAKQTYHIYGTKATQARKKQNETKNMRTSHGKAATVAESNSRTAGESNTWKPEFDSRIGHHVMNRALVQ